MMAFTKLAGKKGRVSWGSNNLSMKSWSLPLKADMLNADTYEKTVNAGDGQYYHEYIVGLVGGEASIEGLWDNTANQHLSGPTLKLQPGALIQASGGAVVSVFLCFDTVSGVGYTITGKISGITPKGDVAVTNDFGFTLQVEAVAYTAQT